MPWALNPWMHVVTHIYRPDCQSRGRVPMPMDSAACMGAVGACGDTQGYRWEKAEPRVPMPWDLKPWMHVVTQMYKYICQSRGGVPMPRDSAACMVTCGDTFI
jgi:hypothetical protein